MGSISQQPQFFCEIVFPPKEQNMRCPYCETDGAFLVVDTSHLADGIRRRRECKQCGKRFTTYEGVVQAMPMLIKSNGAREAFDRDKLVRGIQISCAKRPIPASGINNLVDRIEKHLQNMGQDEVSCRVVGDMVIEGLKELDPIAYIRYAIVYLGLDNLTSVRNIVDNLLAEQNAKPGFCLPTELFLPYSLEPPVVPESDSASS